MTDPGSGSGFHDEERHCRGVRPFVLVATAVAAILPLSHSASLAAEPPPFPSLPKISRDYLGLRAGAGVDAAGKVFRRGHLRLSFRSGTLYPVLTASGSESGFIFQGEGHYAYTSEEAGDKQTFEKNVLAFVNTNAIKDGVLEEDMKGCVFTSGQPLLAEILNPTLRPTGEAAEDEAGGEQGGLPGDTAGTGSGTLASSPGGVAAPSGVSARLARFVEESDDADYGPDHFALMSLLRGAPDAAVFGEIDGNVVNPVYLYDAVETKNEVVFLDRTVQGDRFVSEVSRQVVGSEGNESPVLVTGFDFSMDTDDNVNATVRIGEHLEVRGTVGRVIGFDLRNTLDSAARNWSSHKRTLDVKSVKTRSGTELPFSHRYHELVVELPEIPEQGDVLDLDFDIEYHFLRRDDGNQFFWLGGWPWYPAPMGGDGFKATCHWKLSTRKPYIPIAAGRTISRGQDGDRNTLEAEGYLPTDFPVAFIGKFDTRETERDGVKVRVNVYGPKQARAPEALTEAAFALLDGYGTMLTPFPYKELDVVMIPDSGFWQSPAGLVLISAEQLSSKYGKVFGGSSLAFKDENNRTYAHEVAHQWWGNQVSPREYQDSWISEAMAEYLGTVVFSLSGKDAKEQQLRMQEALAFWRGNAMESRGESSIAQSAKLRGSTARDDYFTILYCRGPLVVHMLRTMLGNDGFFKLVRTIATKYAGKEMSTDDFAREASVFAGEDMTWFFDEWIKEPGIPDLSIRKTIGNEGGKTILSGHLSQSGAPFKALLIPFVFELPGGRRSAKLVRMTEPEQDFRVELPPGAKNVVADPANNNLVNYK